MLLKSKGETEGSHTGKGMDAVRESSIGGGGGGCGSAVNPKYVINPTRDTAKRKLT